MALDDLVAAGIATAKAIVGDGLTMAVTHYASAGKTTEGEIRYPASGVVYQALVDSLTRTMRQVDGSEVTSRTRVTLLEPVTVGPEDAFLLPGDASLRPVLDVATTRDSAGAPMMVEVFF